MPSRVRAGAEWALRAAAFALLGWALWSALRPAPDAAGRAVRSAGVAAEALRDWTRAGPAALHLAIDDSLAPEARDWLVALRRTGTAVSWSGALAPIAIAAEPVSEPGGGTRVLVAAPDGATAHVRDAAGPLDSLTLAGAGGVVRAPAAAGPLSLRVARTTARVAAPESPAPKRVLVLGTAGWESRYTVEALEERGWTVDARLAVAPGIEVRRGTPSAPDTATHAVVIALDSTAGPHARAIAAFARDGGGVILAGASAAIPALGGIAPGRPGARVKPALMAVTESAPRRALGYFPVAAVRANAVTLEEREGGRVTVAHRVGAGRVLQTGEDESWRWRMQGGASGPDAHRRWWSALAGGVAGRAGPLPHGGLADRAAPRAAVAAALGPARQAPDDARPPSPVPLTFAPWMLLVAMTFLLAEWTSRRLRGAA